MYERKDLCADSLIGLVREGFGLVPDKRTPNSPIKLVDILMSGFAVCSQKSPSLLSFDNERPDPRFQKNMKNLYGIERIASDTHMRETLDEIDLVNIRPAFTGLFKSFQRGKCLEPFQFMDSKYLIALDGTGYFSSKNVHCDNCLTKTSKKTGEVTYQHQMVGAVLLHPDKKAVLPLCPEPIIKQDGTTKNDCERNAISRWLNDFRKEHPKLKVIITEDGLASNAPHIKSLQDYNCSFILGAKPGNHKYLFEELDLSPQVERYSMVKDGLHHIFRFINEVSLNESNQEVEVNCLDYQEISKKGVKCFTWVTDIELNTDNVYDVMKGGRARWKIENETFNTLKNQGYNFGHNFGHGHKNLSVIFALFMFLAFAVDQIQEVACQVYQKAKEVSKSFKAFWRKIRAWFELTVVPNWSELLSAIAEQRTTIFPNTS